VSRWWFGDGCLVVVVRWWLFWWWWFGCGESTVGLSLSPVAPLSLDLVFSSVIIIIIIIISLFLREIIECVGELILKCETKFKKLTWHALIGGCRTEVLHRIFIEFILFVKCLRGTSGLEGVKPYFTPNPY
jgi:hypothetical protein